MKSSSYQITVLPGDGIGPEVVAAAQGVLDGVASAYGFTLHYTTAPMGGAGVDAAGQPLPADTLAACLAADAVLLGAVGGPAWDDEPPERRPETGLLQLRKALGVFANLRPVQVHPDLAAASPLRPDLVAGVDLLVVRELTGGIYFGTPRFYSASYGVNSMRYTADEVLRVAKVAFEWARRRKGRVTSVDKANVLEVSRLWRAVVSGLQQTDYPDVELDHLYVDNAAMQLVRDPGRFDVLLTGNLFGDILSDLAATLPGSLGMLPSASLGGSVGLFEPVHGSAPDLAGQGTANPLGTVLSAAMMLDALGEGEAAQAIRAAVAETLADGLRTPDLYTPGCQRVGTAALTEALIAHLPQPEAQPTPL